MFPAPGCLQQRSPVTAWAIPGPPTCPSELIDCQGPAPWGPVGTIEVLVTIGVSSISREIRGGGREDGPLQAGDQVVMGPLERVHEASEHVGTDPGNPCAALDIGIDGPIVAPEVVQIGFVEQVVDASGQL